MSTAETIRLLLAGAAVGISIYAAILSTRAARSARRSLARARASARRAYGETSRAELAAMKMRNRTNKRMR